MADHLPMGFPAHVQYTWWLRWYSTVVVTEEGVFSEDNVPDDYGGPLLTVEVTQRVILCTPHGYLQDLRFDEYQTVLDSDRKAGMGVNVNEFETIIAFEAIAPTGPSAEVMEFKVRENPAVSGYRSKLIEMYKAVQQNTAL